MVYWAVQATSIEKYTAIYLDDRGLSPSRSGELGHGFVHGRVAGVGYEDKGACEHSIRPAEILADNDSRLALLGCVTTTGGGHSRRSTP